MDGLAVRSLQLVRLPRNPVKQGVHLLQGAILLHNQEFIAAKAVRLHPVPARCHQKLCQHHQHIIAKLISAAGYHLPEIIDSHEHYRAASRGKIPLVKLVKGHEVRQEIVLILPVQPCHNARKDRRGTVLPLNHAALAFHPYIIAILVQGTVLTVMLRLCAAKHALYIFQIDIPVIRMYVLRPHFSRVLYIFSRQVKIIHRVFRPSRQIRFHIADINIDNLRCKRLIKLIIQNILHNSSHSAEGARPPYFRHISKRGSRIRSVFIHASVICIIIITL